VKCETRQLVALNERLSRSVERALNWDLGRLMYKGQKSPAVAWHSLHGDAGRMIEMMHLKVL
jgi:hypothetical protein